jgi:hypothetical protein
MISVKQNIETFKKNINDLATQRNEITNEILRLEGGLRVLVDMDKAGVVDIPVTKNPLETNEVIDSVDVQASGSTEEPKND